MSTLRYCVIVPGIRTDLPRLMEWGPRLRDQIMSGGGFQDCFLYDHGWFGALAWRFGERMRARQVRRLQGYIKAIKERVGPGPDVDISIVAHSAGTYLVGHAMTDRGPRSFFDRVVLMACILSSRDDWKQRVGHHGPVLNLWSYSDQVVQFSTFGQAGWKGFSCAPSDVENEEMKGFEHGTYLEPGKAWDELTAFLAA